MEYRKYLNNPKEVRKEEMMIKRDDIEKNNKMVYLDPNKSIVKLNSNGLNTTTKIQ